MKAIVSFLMFFLALSCNSQKKTIALSGGNNAENYDIIGSFKELTVDGFGAIYLLDQRNVLKKYDSNLKLLFEYSFYKQGIISTIDVSNPQKILVYFPEFQNIVYLDNTLSVIQSLNLEKLNYWQINAVALSQDNNTWFYDPNLHQLNKINSSGTIVLSSNEMFNSNYNDSEINTVKISEREVFVFTPNEVLIFDFFGVFLKSIPIESKEVQILKNEILYSKGKNIMRLPLEVTFEIEEDHVVYNSKNDFNDFHISLDGTLYLLEKGGLRMVKLY